MFDQLERPEEVPEDESSEVRLASLCTGSRFTGSCKKMFFPVVTSCITVEQYQNQETDIGTSHRAYSDVISFICTRGSVSLHVCMSLYVCISASVCGSNPIFSRVALCSHHHS